MFKIKIETKSHKSFVINCTGDLESFTKSITKGEILWLDSGSKGIWLPYTEISQILFEKYNDEVSGDQKVCQSDIKPVENAEDLSPVEDKVCCIENEVVSA